MKHTVLATLPFLCSLLSAGDPSLKGGNTLACETYSLRDLIAAGKLDMTTIPDFYKQHRIRGISYNDIYFKSFDDDYVDRVKSAVKQAGRSVVCFVITGNLAMADEAKRREAIELVKRKLHVAARLGAPRVRINLGSTDAREKADDTLGVERVTAAFLEFLPLAKQLKIKMCIENHGGVSATARNIVRIIQGTDPNWVGALVDFGNFRNETRYDEIAAVARYAWATHVSIREFAAQGEPADYDIGRVFSILKEARYKGPLSIEFTGKSDPIEGARRTRDLILKHW